MNQTRESLLAAGVRVYSSLSCDLLKGLSANTVAAEAGYHRQTFYRYWDTQSAYIQDLIAWLLGADKAPVTDGAVALADRPEVAADPATFARHLAHHDLARLIESPAIRMQIGLLSMRALRQEPHARLVSAYYDQTVAALVVAYEGLLDGWGRRMVDGVTVRDLVRILHAHLLGSALMAQALTGDPPVEALTERAVLATIDALTEPVP